MKQKVFRVAIALLLYASTAIAQGGVGINQPVPDPSAALDIVTENQGVLLPRLNTSAILGIQAPAKGLMVLDTAGNDVNIYLQRSTPTTPDWDNLTEDINSSFLVYTDGPQPIPASTPTKPQFVWADFNDGGDFMFGSTNAYVVPDNGVYQFSTGITIDNLGAGEAWVVEIWVDDGSFANAKVSNVSGPVGPPLVEHSGAISTTLRLTLGSLVFVVVTHNSQTSALPLSSNPTYSWFSGHRLY
jgi:hypothetical protein